MGDARSEPHFYVANIVWLESGPANKIQACIDRSMEVGAVRIRFEGNVSNCPGVQRRDKRRDAVVMFPRNRPQQSKGGFKHIKGSHHATASQQRRADAGGGCPANLDWFHGGIRGEPEQPRRACGGNRQRVGGLSRGKAKGGGGGGSRRHRAEHRRGVKSARVYNSARRRIRQTAGNLISRKHTGEKLPPRRT